MSYTHLSQYERYQIQLLHRGGFSSRAIGEQIARSPSTIRRELWRNAQGAPYEARQAQLQSERRRRAASARPRIAESVWSIVREQLAQDLSPEQIVGSRVASISHERIYQYIEADRKAGGSLWTRLRCHKRRRQRRCGTRRQRQRFGGRRISERPAIVQTRDRVGDWEGDTIVGKGAARIVTLVERKTGLARLRRVDSGEDTLIDPYASDDPGEFFAVLSESFFEIPDVVAGEYPALYDLLRRYYRQDPLARLTKAASASSTAAS